MRHKWLAILLLGIVLVYSLPAQAFAAEQEKEKEKKFSATMTVVGLFGGTVTPIPRGASGKDIKAWTLKGRNLTASLAGDINGGIVLVASGILDTNQTGVLNGNLTIDGRAQGDRKDLITGQHVVSLKGRTAQPIPNIYQFIADKLSLAYLPYLMFPVGSPDAVISFATLPVTTTGNLEMDKGTDSYAGFHAEAKLSGMVTVILGYYPGGVSHVVGMLPNQQLSVTGTMEREQEPERGRGRD